MFPHVHCCSFMGYHSRNGIKLAMSSLETAVKNKDILHYILMKERNLGLSLEKCFLGYGGQELVQLFFAFK